MSLVEEYYELNEAEEVSVIWKIVQITFYVAAGGLGLVCGYTIALLRENFDHKCYLFTTIKINSYQIDVANTFWEDDSWCDFCQYSMVSSFIVATIWATFFLMCGKGGKSLTGLPQPWRIVWPSFIFNFMYFIVSLCTAFYLQKGTEHFCQRKDRIKPKTLEQNCKPLVFLVRNNSFTVLLQLDVVAKTSWGCAASWLVLFLTPFFRIVFVSDFHIYKVCVFKIGDNFYSKKEEVLRITNYEEPRKMIKNKLMPPQEFEARIVEVEEGRTMKNTPGTNSQRPFRNFSGVNPNTAFYFTTDIRMLSRKKKGKKNLHSFHDSYEKSPNDFHLDAKKMNKNAPVEMNLDNSEFPEFPHYIFHQNLYSEKIFDYEKGSGSSSTLRDLENSENESESGSHSKVYISVFESDQSIKDKKLL